MCNHLWTYRNNQSECMRCPATAQDGRGLPHGSYAVNGKAMTLSELQMSFACPECYADINPRVVGGELRILCAGADTHDIVALGRAVSKATRDYRVARQESDAIDVLYGLKKRGDKVMPILDLQQDAGPRLKRAGIIRLGIKKKNAKGTEYPFATDYFVLSDAPGVADVCKNERPNKLNIMFPFNEIERNFPAWHQLWVAGGLLCRGNGERIEYAVEHKTGEIVVRNGRATRSGEADGLKLTTGHPVRCSGMNHDLYPRCQKCKPSAMLIVMLREMPRLVYYQIATGSIHNIIKLTGQMRYLQEWLGGLQGIPFVLELRPEMISTPSGKNGTRARREKYLLNLEVDPEWVAEMFKVMRARALPAVTQKVLTGPQPMSNVDAAWSVDGLDDEPEWEPVEHFNGEPSEDIVADAVDDDAKQLPQVVVTEETVTWALNYKSARGTPFYLAAGTLGECKAKWMYILSHRESVQDERALEAATILLHEDAEAWLADVYERLTRPEPKSEPEQSDQDELEY